MLAFDDGMEDESGSPRASHGKASRWRRRNASSSAGSSEDGPLARLSPQLNGSDGSGPVAAPPRKPRPGPSGLETVGEEQLLRSGSVGAAGLTGMRCYARLVLGRQQHTSWIKKERLDGTLNLHQTFVFAVPLPLRDRQLRLELYRTASNTQRGRLVSIQQVRGRWQGARGSATNQGAAVSHRRAVLAPPAAGPPYPPTRHPRPNHTHPPAHPPAPPRSG